MVLEKIFGTEGQNPVTPVGLRSFKLENYCRCQLVVVGAKGLTNLGLELNLASSYNL